ncbi:hypothetical protein KKB44_03300 [Candidatus Micrarchaeota archaeon]|nr:hypothetical protein [Candidatus Micrarchaeota archaeon]
MLRRLFVVSLILLSLTFSIAIVSPVNADVDESDIIDLGIIGPGQTIYVQIDPIVSSGGTHGIGGTYDMAVAENLPEGWESSESKLYQNPLQVTITADPDTPEGNYSVRINVIDEFNGENLGNVSFILRVQVTWDVLDFEVTPISQTVGPGQPAVFDITIKNKASTSDAFQVSAEGARRWEFTKPVFVPAKSSRTISYEIVGTEEENYAATIKIVSLASSNIADEENVTLSIESNLLGDYKATNNGAIVFPIFELPIYSLAGLLSNFFG